MSSRIFSIAMRELKEDGITHITPDDLKRKIRLIQRRNVDTICNDAEREKCLEE